MARNKNNARPAEDKDARTQRMREQEERTRKLLDGWFGWVMSIGLILFSALNLLIGMGTGSMPDTITGLLYLLGGIFLMPVVRRSFERMRGQRMKPMNVVIILMLIFGVSLTMNFLREAPGSSASTEPGSATQAAQGPQQRYLAPAQQGLYWGWIDTKGQWAIKPRFDAAGAFSQGRAAAVLEGQPIWVDTQGDTSPRDSAFTPQPGTAPSWQGTGFLDADGQPLPDSLAAKVQPPRFRYQEEGYAGFVDAQGRAVVPASYRTVGAYQPVGKEAP